MDRIEGENAESVCCCSGKAVHYCNVLYRKDGQEPVDVIIYFDRQFKDA